MSPNTTSCKSLQGYWLQHYSGQPVPGLEKPFSKEIFLNTQLKSAGHNLQLFWRSYSNLESTTQLKITQQSPLQQQRLYLDRRGEKNLNRGGKMLKEAVQGCWEITINRNCQKWYDFEIDLVLSKRLGWMTLRNPSSREFFQDSLIPKLLQSECIII